MLSIYVFSYFPFGFEGRIWDLILSVPDHCLLVYFTTKDSQENMTFTKIKTRINIRANSFSNRIVDIWNAIPNTLT